MGSPLDDAALPATLMLGAADLVPRRQDGARALALFEALSQDHPTAADRLSAMLAAGFEPPDTDAAPGPAAFDRMAIMERHAALLRIALSFGTWPHWFVARCAACGALNDLKVAAGEFAYAPPRRRLACFEVEGPGGARAAFRVPNGMDERHLSAAEHTPVDLLRRLALAPAALDGQEEAWIAPFEAALAGVSACQETALAFCCADCGAEGHFWFDPVDWIGRHTGVHLRAVHRLARAYGWTESAILALPETRRAAYLALLDAAP